MKTHAWDSSFDPAGALALIQSVPDPDERSDLLAAHVGTIAADDPDAALALALSLEGHARSRSLDAVVWALVEASPERVVDALRELAVEDVRAFPYGPPEALVDNVARARPEVVPGLDDPAERIAANAGLWAMATLERPDLAVDALSALDPSERLATFERAVPLVGPMDPRWLAGLVDDDRLAPAERAAVERWADACGPEPF